MFAMTPRHATHGLSPQQKVRPPANANYRQCHPQARSGVGSGASSGQKRRPLEFQGYIRLVRSCTASAVAHHD